MQTVNDWTSYLKDNELTLRVRYSNGQWRVFFQDKENTMTNSFKPDLAEALEDLVAQHQKSRVAA